MGLAGGNVLAIQVPIEIDRGVDLLHDGGRTGRKTPTPHRVAHDAFVAALADSLLGHQDSPTMNNSDDVPACKASVETARRMTPLVHGEVAAVAVANAPKSLPVLAFKDGSGTA